MYTVTAYDMVRGASQTIGQFATRREANHARKRIATTSLNEKTPHIIPKMYDANGVLLRDGWQKIA